MDKGKELACSLRSGECLCMLTDSKILMSNLLHLSIILKFLLRMGWSEFRAWSLIELLVGALYGTSVR